MPMNFNGFWKRNYNIFINDPKLCTDEGLNDRDFCKLGWDACKEEVLRILDHEDVDQEIIDKIQKI